MLNGWELGSGSVRIHRADIQSRVFKALGISDEEAESRFGFLLGAFKYGAPPHAGFAVGLDRLVAIFAGEENIREVIAFPKTQSGADLMTGAPKSISERQIRDLRLKIAPKGSEPRHSSTTPSPSASSRRPRSPTSCGPGPSTSSSARTTWSDRRDRCAASSRPSQLTSMILWGPAGTGKTTLARILATSAGYATESLSAVTSGVKDVREAFVRANERLGEHGQRTVLFIDEVHRFNKAQQDLLLPATETGEVVLIGATTENPYFEVNAALMSRSTLWRLRSLAGEDLAVLVRRGLALRGASIDR